MKHWNSIETDFLISKIGNTTVSQISRIMGRSVRSIGARANYLGYRTNLTTSGKPALLSRPRVNRSKFVFTPEEQKKMSLIKLMLTRAQSQAAMIGQPASINLELFAASYHEYKAMMHL